MDQVVLGIDIAKKSYQVTLLLTGKSYHRTFSNTPGDFPALAKWLSKHRVSQVRACMEATGTWWEALATWLHEQGHRVSVVNPAQIRDYARSQLRRNKTDRLDGDVIADFAAQQPPRAWTPPAPELRQLQALVRYLDDVQGMHTQEVNRLASGIPAEAVRQRLEQHLAFLEQQLLELKTQLLELIEQHPELQHQQALLSSIPGIGQLTAARLVAENLLRFDTTRQLVAYAGLNPQVRQSGTSLHGKPQLSKIGSSQLRKTLYLPALSAVRHNPLVRALGQRLAERGKCKKSILGAAMRKLLCLAFGVLKSGLPFDPHYRDKVHSAT